MITRWDDPENDKRLREFVEQGLSSREIAAAMGRDFTKGMISGRCNRLGLRLGHRAPTMAEPSVSEPKKAPRKRDRAAENERRRQKRAAERVLRLATEPNGRDYEQEERRTAALKRQRNRELPIPEETLTEPLPSGDVSELHGYDWPVAREPVEEIPSTTHYGVFATTELRRDQCRYPFGGPNDDDFHYCQRAKQGASAYCSMHMAKTTNPELTAKYRGKKAKRTHYQAVKDF